MEERRAAGSAPPPYNEGGININYVSKGRLQLYVYYWLYFLAVSRALRLREFAGTSSRETCFLIDRRYGCSYYLFLLPSRIYEFFELGHNFSYAD